jgi:hypothetical protein
MISLLSLAKKSTPLNIADGIMSLANSGYKTGKIEES